MVYDKYFNFVKNEIIKILSNPVKQKITYDILLDSRYFDNINIICLRQKQLQMKIGHIWQVVLGNYKNYINLKQNHISGLDIINYDKKIIIELKNRTNTDNSSSRKQNFNKLSKFKKENPEYRCIYGNINDSTEAKTIIGIEKKIINDNVEIEFITGYKFLKTVLENDTDKIIKFVKNTINSYLESNLKIEF